MQLDPRITGLFKTRPKLAHAGDWAKVSLILSTVNTDPKEDAEVNQLVTSFTPHIGEGAALQLAEWIDILSAKMPTRASIYANPLKALVPKKLIHQYATAASLSKELTAENAEASIAYLRRFPPDLMAMALLDAVARNQSLEQVKAVTDGFGPDCKDWLQLAAKARKREDNF